MEFLSRIIIEVSSGPRLTTREVIGITVSIAGNVLISFSLNLQKLAHRRLELTEDQDVDSGRPSRTAQDNSRGNGSSLSHQTPNTNAETEPLLPLNIRSLSETVISSDDMGKRKNWYNSVRVLLRTQSANDAGSSVPVSVFVTPATPLPDEPESTGSQTPGNEGSKKEGVYLRSKLWWLGFVLMNVGEGGNFISYGFAPASIVAPLGTFALIANCAFAPLLLDERFRKLDMLGIAIAVIGAVTVVLSSNASDGRLDHKGLLRAISDPPFVGYSIACIITVAMLAGVSARKQRAQAGHDLAGVGVDVGICAIFGGFTVLSTKAISTLLTNEGLGLFTHWIAYPLLIILIGTGIGQIMYLNRALMRFDSKLVIPTQFVLFNLSAIVGSAILYGDFRKATFHQMVTFLYGCAATFAGVFILAWTPGQTDTNADDEEQETLNEGLDTQAPETIPFGSLASRRGRRLTVTIPSGVPIQRLRHKPSLGLMGGMSPSPAQRLLLVHSPQREHDTWLRNGSVDSTRVRKVTSWYASTDVDGNEASLREWPRGMRARSESPRPV